VKREENGREKEGERIWAPLQEGLDSVSADVGAAPPRIGQINVLALQFLSECHLGLGHMTALVWVT
jgi:hypothetical protein